MSNSSSPIVKDFYTLFCTGFNDITWFFSDNQLFFQVKKSQIKSIISVFKKHQRFRYNLLVDITAVDYPNKVFRFELVYQLLSIRNNNRINIKTQINSYFKPDTVFSLFNNANWCEREVFDLFGISFRNHPDLRRLLTDYGFEGSPLRKDFPLIGYYEVFYDSAKKRVSSQSLNLSQSFRSYKTTHSLLTKTIHKTK